MFTNINDCTLTFGFTPTIWMQKVLTEAHRFLNIYQYNLLQ